MRLLDRISLAIERRAVTRERRALGLCAALSANGYVCTRSDPHRIHVALAAPDAHEVDRWISREDRPS